MDTKEQLGFLSSMLAFSIIFGYIAAGTHCLGNYYNVTVDVLVIAGFVPAILMLLISMAGFCWIFLDWNI